MTKQTEQPQPLEDYYTVKAREFIALASQDPRLAREWANTMPIDTSLAVVITAIGLQVSEMRETLDRLRANK